MNRNSKSLPQEIAMRLQQIILNGSQYKPNEKIPDERTLAEKLGVSRTSIREAIKILVGNGLLTVKRGVGTFVADNPSYVSDPLRLASIEDQTQLQVKWYEFRIMVEPESMLLVAERITDTELEQLIKSEQNCAEQIKNGSEWADADTEFHTLLAKATHNEIIERLMAGVSESISAGVSNGRETVKENALKNHRLIVEYLKNRDGVGAYNAMRLHLLQGLRDIETEEQRRA